MKLITILHRGFLRKDKTEKKHSGYWKFWSMIHEWNETFPMHQEADNARWKTLPQKEYIFWPKRNLFAEKVNTGRHTSWVTWIWGDKTTSSARSAGRERNFLHLKFTQPGERISVQAYIPLYIKKKASLNALKALWIKELSAHSEGWDVMDGQADDGGTIQSLSLCPWFVSFWQQPHSCTLQDMRHVTSAQGR